MLSAENFASQTSPAAESDLHWWLKLPHRRFPNPHEVVDVTFPDRTNRRCCPHCILVDGNEIGVGDDGFVIGREGLRQVEKTG